jgi:iron uptake system component EfeO
MNIPRPVLLAAGTLIGALALSGCVANTPDVAGAASGQSGSAGAAAGGALAVSIADDSCEVSAATIGSGTVTFSLTNNGTVRNEFEILAEDKLRIVGERENLGTGTTVDYTVVLEPGTYYTACKKNMVGDLVGAAEFAVTDSGAAVEVSADEQELIDEAVTNYTAYVKDQSGQLLTKTQEFAGLYTSGDVEGAKDAYAPARMYYERIEPTAEAFGDIDPALDLREADWQDECSEGTWTGWHAIEKDLWRPDGYAGLSDAERQAMADQLVSDTQKLYDLVYSSDFSVNIDDISNGAISLLEEVATTKITGEKEAFSHTDLWDFVANIEGAKVAYGNVEALAEKKDPELASEISSAFDDMDAELATFKDGEGYVSYDTVDEAGRKKLSDTVNALRLPLAQLTAAIVE